MLSHTIIVCFTLCIICKNGISQTYSSLAAYHVFYEFTVGSAANCEEGGTSCAENYIGQIWIGLPGTTFTPEGLLYFLGPDLFEVNPSTGFATLVFDIPQPPILISGLLGVGAGIFYLSGSEFSGPDSLYKIDLNANTFTNEGQLPYEMGNGFCMFNGEAYYTTLVGSGSIEHIVRLNFTDPSQSELVTTLESFVTGISATNKCNTLIATVDWEHNPELVYVNLIDGAVTHICSTEAKHIIITSMQEFVAVDDCDFLLDLDCNDSSGATDADYNADEIDCLDNETAVADIDIGMEYDAIMGI